MNIHGLTPNSESRRDKILLEMKEKEYDVILICETNGVISIPGYITHHTALQTPCKGINIAVKCAISSQAVAELEGHLLTVKVYNPDLVIMALHVANQHMLEKLNSELNGAHYEIPTFIYADANSFEEQLRIPAKWIRFKKTFERGEQETAPDVVGFIGCEGRAEIGSKMSDHYSLYIEVKWPGTKDVSSVFPYSIKNCMKAIRKGKLNPAWPREPSMLQEVAKQAPMRQKIWANPDYIGNPQWKKLASDSFFCALERAWKENDLKAVYNMVKRRCCNKEKSLALHILQDGNLTPLSQALHLVKEYYGQMFFKEEEPTDFKPDLLLAREPDISLLYRKKALGWDLVPDRILERKFIQEKGKPDRYEAVFPFLYKNVEDFYKSCSRIPLYVKQGRLVLLSKVDKPNVSLQNTRPISIMPWLYKGFELSIKEKLDNALWPRIGPWQRGFRPGANTHYNIVDLKNWMFYRKHIKSPSIILYVDIKKAFDHVIRRKLIEKLKAIEKVDVDTLNTIKDLFSETCIRLGDICIPTNVGVPQGGLLSPLLFDLYLEDCLRELYNARGPSGIVLAYADNILVAGDPGQLSTWEAIIETWGVKWNLWVEWKKCLICRYRAQVKSKASSATNFRYLGVNITWRERVPRCTMDKWVKQRKGTWYKRNTLVTRLAMIWFDISLLHYKFYADYARGKISELEINTAAIRIARKRLKVPGYVDNWTLQEMIWLDPATTMFRRACNEGYKTDFGQFQGRDFELSKKIWKEVYAKRSVASIAAVWQARSFKLCKVCDKPFTKFHLSRHPNFRIWARWFLGRSLFQALLQLEKQVRDPRKILKIFDECEPLGGYQHLIHHRQSNFICIQKI